MRWGLTLLALFASIGLAVHPSGASAEAVGRDNGVRPSEISSQDRTVERRVRPRLRVTPRQPSAWPYPRPGTYSWPGPNAVRECRSWLEPEARMSGTVIVPRMRCWWAPG